MKQPIRNRLLSLLLVFLLLVSMMPAALAGEDDEGGGTSTEEYTLTSVTIDPGSVALKVGQTQALSATVTLTKTNDNSTVEITSTSDTKLPQGYSLSAVWNIPNDRGDEATVTAESDSLKATLKALKTPETQETTDLTAQVTVTLKKDNTVSGESKTAECTVDISPTDPAGITVAPDTLELKPGDTSQLRATVTPTTADQTVTWNSDDPAIATVDGKGLVTGKAAGVTRVSGTSKAGDVDYCDVTVQGIVLEKKELTLKEGENTLLKHTVYGPSIEKNRVEWTSDNPAVAKVESGYIYPLSEGTANITATVTGTTYSETCKITVERNVATPVTPSPINPGTALCFKNLTSELQNRCTTVLKKDLQYLSGLSVSTKEGTLYYKYRSDDDTGRGISPTDTFYLSGSAPKGDLYPTASTGRDVLDEVFFVPQPGFSGTATISYTGYAGNMEFFQGTIEVTVNEVDHLTYTAAAGVPLQFRAEDFNNVCLNTTGRNLKNVVFTLPDSSRGTLYRNYISATSPGIAVREGDALQYTGTPNLSDVYFVPAVGYDGTVILSYTATDVNGQTFRSRVEISLTPAAGSGDINYTVSQGGTVTLALQDFKNLCKDFTGGVLDYVRFTLPEASQGTLYFDYTSASKPGTAVTENQSYYADGSPSLGKITFAASSSGAGVCAIPFTGWDTKGNNFSGQVEIAIRISGAGDIRYTANSKGEADFKASDFNDLCKDLTGESLNYVQFTLPASGQGTLYLNYTNSNSTKVTAGQKYYRSSTPSVGKITFVAASGFTGAASIPFTGWSTGGGSFTGTVEVQVDEVTSGSLSYTVRQGKSVTFGAGDFNSYCREETGQDLRYVRFTLPAVSQGTLYYDYTDASSKKVTASQSYYRTSSPYLDRVTFVPAAYLGTVTVYFDGWSTGGKTFSGAVKITVEENPDAVITYNSAYAPVRFRAADFLKACQAQGVADVTSVTFTPPGSTWGRLYYQYTAPLQYSSEVRASTSYYLTGSPSLSDITFVPKAGRQGTVTIAYVATGSSGKTCAGTVRIVLQPSTYSQYFTDMGSHSWAAAAVDYLYENNITTGTGSGRYQPASAMSRGDFMVMVVRAFGLTSSGGSSFPDVPQGAYYADAVATAKALGIATGYEDGTFKPGNTLSRQEAMVFLQRAFQAAGWYIGDGSQSTLDLYPDGDQVAGYARGAVAAMVEWGILYGKDGLLDPWGALTRAEMAVLLHRALTL